MAATGVLGLAAVFVIHEPAEAVVIANGVRAGRRTAFRQSSVIAPPGAVLVSADEGGAPVPDRGEPDAYRGARRGHVRGGLLPSRGRDVADATPEPAYQDAAARRSLRPPRSPSGGVWAETWLTLALSAFPSPFGESYAMAQVAARYG